MVLYGTLVLLADVLEDPGHAVLHSLARHGRASLDLPLTIADGVKIQARRDL